MNSEGHDLDVLDAVFLALPSGGDAPNDDRAAVEQISGPKTATYGEITKTAIGRLGRWMRPEAQDVFIDLGSGVGRMPLQLAVTHPLGLAVGVELSPFRHGVAQAARAELIARLPHQRLAARTQLIEGDARDAALAEATLIFVGATCFSDDFLRRLAINARAAHRLRSLLTTKALPAGCGFKERGSVHVPMTWAPRVRVHLYER